MVSERVVAKAATLAERLSLVLRAAAFAGCSLALMGLLAAVAGLAP